LVLNEINGDADGDIQYHATTHPNFHHNPNTNPAPKYQISHRVTRDELTY